MGIERVFLIVFLNLFLKLKRLGKIRKCVKDSMIKRSKKIKY